MNAPIDDLPPRNPKPRPKADHDDPTTFRPNPSANPNPNRARKAPKAGAGMLATEDPGKGPTTFERLLFGRISSGQLAAFCRQLAAYQNAGVDLTKALTSMQLQFNRTALGPVIGRLTLGVRRGDSLAELVAREPQTFDALFQSMIKVAEARGGVPETLKLLGRHYEARQSLIRQARSALIYPIIVLFMTACVVALMTIWILPMFASMLRDIAGKSAQLPLASRILLGFSDFIGMIGWLAIPVALFGTPILLLQLYKTPRGKVAMDRVLIRIPVFGLLMRKIDTSRFARTLSALLDAGVDMGSSLDLTASVLRLDPFRQAVADSRLLVLHGMELSEALDSTRRFGPDVIEVINSGEETGKLPETLDHLADDYEEQVAYMVRNMGQLVQPLLMIVLGLVVLFVILAVLLPYIQMINSLAGGGG